MQILDVKALNKEEIENRFKHLFEINEKEKGGNLYLQSKVFFVNRIYSETLVPGVQSKGTNRCRAREANRRAKTRRRTEALVPLLLGCYKIIYLLRIECDNKIS